MSELSQYMVFKVIKKDNLLSKAWHKIHDHVSANVWDGIWNRLYSSNISFQVIHEIKDNIKDRIFY